MRNTIWSKIFESFNRRLLLLYNSLKSILFKKILIIFHLYKYCLIYFNKMKNQPFLFVFLPLFQFFSLHISNFWESNSYLFKRWIAFLSLISFYSNLSDIFFFFFWKVREERQLYSLSLCFEKFKVNWLLITLFSWEKR